VSEILKNVKKFKFEEINKIEEKIVKGEGNLNSTLTVVK